MSDHAAIAGVSATLQALLYDRMERPGSDDVEVTVGPPRFPPKDGGAELEKARVNLFLYRVTEHAYLENQEIPGRGGSSGYGQPPLSLNLHYLLTAYGNEQISRYGSTNGFDEKVGHAVLGSAMRVLHDHRVVNESLVSVRPPSGVPLLDPGLRGEREHIKVSLEPLSLEDITKVWTALSLRCRLSASYAVSVVQIEGTLPRRFPRPVSEPPPPWPPRAGTTPATGPQVLLRSIQLPSITELRVRRGGTGPELPWPYARTGDSLVLHGTGLAGGVSSVRLGELDVPAPAARGDRLEVPVPDAALPDGTPIPPERRLLAGPLRVGVEVSEPGQPLSALRSNELVLMLVPSLASATFEAGPPRTLRLSGSRLVSGPGGEVVIGKSIVPRRGWLLASPAEVALPLPDELPASGVVARLSAPLPDPVLLTGAPALEVSLGGRVARVVLNLPPSVARAELPMRLQAALRDAASAAPSAEVPDELRPALAGARVGMHADALAVVLGGLVTPFEVTSSAPVLGFPSPPAPPRALGVLSGTLRPFPRFGATPLRLAVRVGPAGPLLLQFGPPRSPEEAASGLEAALRAAAGGPELSGAWALALGAQLLILPGGPEPLAFEGLPGDEESVAALQLFARYGVRLRAGGAESLDDAWLELPR